MTLKEKADAISSILKKLYPHPVCHLDFSNVFELTVSTILAAQCTDERVNAVMTPLYKTRYKSPKDILTDGLENFKENIKSITFPNSKAKSILNLAEQLTEKFKGQVPDSMDELINLSGIGRKSANVILGNVYGRKDCVIVDTHLKRVSERLGLIKNSDADKIEYELKELIPEKEQFNFSMRVGEHGRQVCKAKKPDCKNCKLKELCEFYKTNKKTK